MKTCVYIHLAARNDRRVMELYDAAFHYVVEHGWEFVDAYVDVAHDRARFDALELDVDTRSIEVVVTPNIFQFGESPRLLVARVTWLLNGDVRVFSMDDGEITLESLRHNDTLVDAFTPVPIKRAG